MSELFLMVSILDRNRAKNFLTLYETHGITVNFVSLARGTAANDILDMFGLESHEKMLVSSIVTRDVWRQVKYDLQQKLNIDIPGHGIAFIVPLSSIGGRRQLEFLTEHQNFVKGEETTLKDTKYELLVVIANQGYTDLIMEAARKANAGGGTIIHAKGTGMDGASKFLGFSLASEKDMVYIVVKHEEKNKVMQAIMDDAGMNSMAKSIIFSLPVTSTAGMRMMDLPPEIEE